MSKQGSFIGGTFGSLIGLFIGLAIPSEAEIVASTFSRITTNAIMQDPVGSIIGLVYTMVAASICGALGALIGGIFD